MQLNFTSSLLKHQFYLWTTRFNLSRETIQHLNTLNSPTFTLMASKIAKELDVEQFSTINFLKILSKRTSIFTPKTCSTERVLKIFSTSNSKRFSIQSDSFSVLLSIKNWKLDNTLIIKLLRILNSKSHTNKVIFCWIQSHIGIQGDHKAGLLVKSALAMVTDENSKYYTLT